jgi:hypothetical protein
LPTFRVELYRLSTGGPIRVTPQVNSVRGVSRFLTDDQIRDRLAQFTFGQDIQTILRSLDVRGGQHTIVYPAEDWPGWWNSEEAFFRFWDPTIRSR